MKHLALAFGSIACMSLVACGDFGGRAAEACDDGGACPEAGPEPAGPDAASLGDSGAPANYDPSVGIPASEPGTMGEFTGRAEDSLDPSTCYDGDDNDASAPGIDCADPGCGALPSCCVGSGTDLCCLPLGAASPVPAMLAFGSGCTGDPAASCLTGVTSFGDPGPWVRDGMLHPGGDESYDSGLIVGGALDLTAMRVTVRTTIGFPAVSCTDACLEGVGIAFTEQPTLGDNTHVRPLFALFASGARGDVVLLVGDSVVHRWSTVDPAEPWEMSVLPTGVVEVAHAGESASATVPMTDSARLVIYGRNRNLPATSGIGASLGDVTISASLCDMPSAWRDRARLLVRPSAMATPVDTGRMRGPTVAHDGTRLVMVYQDGSAFYAAGRGGDDITFIQLNTSAVLEPKTSYDRGGISDPELVRIDGGWWLFYTATDDSGRRTIGRASAAGGTPLTFEPAPDPWVRPTGLEVGLSMPSVLQHPTRTNVYIMVARAELASGAHRLALFVSMDGGETFRSFSPESELDEETTRPPLISTTAFDLDEIAHPSIVIHRGAYHLYYAGRRGTRWAIGMRVSDELVFWREANGGAPVFAADGNGGDRLSVRDPDVWPSDTGVELFYAGNDGARDALFRSWRLSSTDMP